MMKLLRGRSGRDRISFMTSDRKISAIRKENGTIEFAENEDEATRDWSGMIWILLCIMKVYIIIPLIQKGILGMAWYLLPALFLFILMIVSITKLKSEIGEEGLRNHGAEHKVFTAYRKLKRIPTIEEARKYSRISRYCGITILSTAIIAQLIGFALYACVGYRISELLLYFGTFFFHSTFPFNGIGILDQIFTTRKPKDENIELAIAALSELKRREERKEWISEIVNTALKK